MKKIFIAVLFFVFLTSPIITSAVYIDPVSRESIKTEGSNCFLTPDPAQKNATTVYTLNIALTNEINTSYLYYWGRYARCDELQFHAERATPPARLKTWLAQVEISRYQNHQYDGTISTGDHKVWRLINGHRQRIYDWLTMVAWGYLPADNRSIPSELTEQFFQAYPELASLQYNQGPYFEQVDDMWRNGTRTADVPARLLDELVEMGFGGYGYFLYRDPCSIGTHDRGWNCKVFDFSFAYQNAQVAPH